MEIRKIGAFTEEEFTKLNQAGTVLGTLKRAFEAGEITELDTNSLELVKALQEVISKVSK